VGYQTRSTENEDRVNFAAGGWLTWVPRRDQPRRGPEIASWHRGKAVSRLEVARGRRRQVVSRPALPAWQ